MIWLLRSFNVRIIDKMNELPYRANLKIPLDPSTLATDGGLLKSYIGRGTGKGSFEN